MSIRKDKEKIIKEIMDLRTLIGNIHSGVDNFEVREEAQRQLNKIQDMVFNM